MLPESPNEFQEDSNRRIELITSFLFSGRWIAQVCSAGQAILRGSKERNTSSYLFRAAGC